MNIGLTQRVLLHKNRQYDSIEHGWYSCLINHNLIFIPNRMDIQDIDIDLLIVTGGDDHPIRDYVEKALIQKMIGENKPIIGICHGAFLLTEMFGGKVSRIDGHMDIEHLISCNGRVDKVNSFHTLQIIKAPDSAEVLAHDDHNICEAWMYNNIGAVVWHPERMETPLWPNKIKELLND